MNIIISLHDLSAYLQDDDGTTAMWDLPPEVLEEVREFATRNRLALLRHWHHEDTSDCRANGPPT
jgi:hypothetical protein